MGETTFRGLTHRCEDPACHVAAFVATLSRKAHQVGPCSDPDCVICNRAAARIIDDLNEHKAFVHKVASEANVTQPVAQAVLEAAALHAQADPDG